MEFGTTGSQGLQFCGGRSGNHRRCSEGERMLTEKDSAYVLLLGLGLWIADRAVQELRRLRDCLLYTSPSPRDLSTSRMPSSA